MTPHRFGQWPLLCLCIATTALLLIVMCTYAGRQPISGLVSSSARRDVTETLLPQTNVSDFNDSDASQKVAVHATLSARRAKPEMSFVDVIVIVTSPAGWLDRRQRIRKQFPRNLRLVPNSADQHALLKFALGTQGISDQELLALHEEANQFSDILLFECLDEDGHLKHPPNWHLDEVPSSTTRKVMLSIQWAVQRYTFDYFFRLGDDSYFRIDLFLEMISLKQIPTAKAVIGHIMTDTVFNMQQIYPQGMGYGLTYDVCLFVSSNVGSLLDTAPEDCVVARWLFAIGARFVDSPRWRDIELGEGCKPDMVLAHKLPAELWENITKSGLVQC